MRLHHAASCLLACALALPACGFNPSGDDLDGGGDLDDAPDPADAGDAGSDAAAADIDHVLTADEQVGTGDLTLDADVTLDTGALTLGAAPLPAGVELVAATQDGGGPELAILRVATFEIDAGVTLHAVGTRPLVVIADTIRISGLLDAGARRGQPGAGGLPPRMGVGFGSDGTRAGTYTDGGGGGGGFGQVGAPGGDAEDASGGDGGFAYGDPPLTRLEGGSGGGATDTGGCDATSPGAGGGALQLYAATSITITGAVNAGGGGGNGGASCGFQYLAGTGGGAGGAIYLQSPSITSTGTIAANGGGGGGGASASSGGAGQDGSATTARATGGTSGGESYGAVGGRGAARVGDATPGANGPSLGNGGGGGGGTGRIVLRHRGTLVEGTTSPAPVTSTY